MPRPRLRCGAYSPRLGLIGRPAVSALPNPRHEGFCQAYIRGEHAGNGSAAYKLAFGTKSAKAAGVGASKLLKKAIIRQRLNELQGQVAEIEAKATDAAIEKLGITKEKVLTELARMGLSNMLDYVQPQADGTVKIDLSALERDTAAAIQEVTVDTFVEGRGDDAQAVRRVRFKLCDKRAALDSLAKLAGFLLAERMPGADQNININVKAELVDRPPRETFKQWEERRKRELANKGKPK